MTTTIQSLNELSLDALREVGNIGAGNAMTALATMLDHCVDMSVPHVGLVPLSEFTQLTGGGESIAACIYLPVEGDAPGHVAFILPERSALNLADELLGQAPGSSTQLGEMECSALMEVGNILTSSYLMAIGDMTGLNLLSTPPAFAVDIAEAVLSSIASVFAEMGDQALTIATHIHGGSGEIEGFFVYVPNPGSLRILLRALQMEE